MAIRTQGQPALAITVDETRCCGSGNCVLTAPGVFDQREADGVVTVLDPVPSPEQHDRVRTAADRCPTSAIGVTEGPES